MKREAEVEEGMRAWDESTAEAEARMKAEIASIAAKASERANIKAEVRLMEMAEAAKRKTEESGARIRAREEAETAKR